MEPRKRILFTDGSSITARELLFALGPHHVIDLIDPARFCQARFSRFVHRHYRCPPFSQDPRGYLAFLLERLQTGEYDVLLPTHEQVYLLSRCRDVLSRFVGLAVPPFASLHRLQSKAEFARLMAELDLPTPETAIVHTRDELLACDAFPCFVKSDFSTAGVGVRRVSDRASMQAVADELQRLDEFDGQSEFVVQRQVGGAQAVFYAVFQHGRLLASHSIELTRPGSRGWAMCGKSVDHPLVEEHLSRLGASLNWHGALFLDYFYDPHTSQPSYIECNPRIGGACHAQRCGVDLAGQLVRISCGTEVEPLPPGQADVRFHHGLLMLLARALENGNRRQVMHELLQQWTRRGDYSCSQDSLTRPGDDLWSVLPKLFTSTALLINPRTAHDLTNKAVQDYSLSEQAARFIRETPLEQLLPPHFRQRANSLAAK